MKKVLISILIGVVVIVTVIAAVILVNQNREQEELGLTTIQLNEVTRSVFYAPQYVAIANGYFAQQGLEIELTTGGGADKVMTAVLADQSDIGFARARSINLRI